MKSFYRKERVGMADFSNILDRGKRLFSTKNKGGKWTRCEECGERRFCFAYDDDEEETWFLCEECTYSFVKDEE